MYYIIELTEAIKKGQDLLLVFFNLIINLFFYELDYNLYFKFNFDFILKDLVFFKIQ